MRWLPARRSEPNDAADTPTYMRPWFVLGAVVITVVLGLVVARSVSDTSGQVSGVDTATNQAVDVEDEATPQSTDPDDCPDPGLAVPFEAAELLTLLQAAAADPTIGDIPATSEVQDQLDATAPSPPLSRMTRVRGFAGDSSTVSTCVLSYWTGTSGSMQSLDVVTVAVVDGDQRSDARGRSPRNLPDRWEVVRWLRGVPVPATPARVVPLAFFDETRCSNPDREVSVPVPEGEPNQRLRSALEELISGPAGRSRNAESSVPADLQVLLAEVAGTSVRVELTPTSDETMTRCEGTAAHAQIVQTAQAVAAESAPADPGPDARSVDVEVVVQGTRVQTLRG